MTFPLQDPLPGQFDYILQDIRGGLVLPDHFADSGEGGDQGEQGTEYTRWWEDPTDPDYAQFQQTYGTQKGR